MNVMGMWVQKPGPFFALIAMQFSHYVVLPFMMLAGLGTVLWGANSLTYASAFASPTFLSSAASNAFVSRRSAVGTSGTVVAPRRRRQQQRRAGGSSTSSSGGTVMLFDFIKDRAKEGVEQTQNLVTAAQTGRLDEALKETSAYVKDRRVSEADEYVRSSVVGDTPVESMLRWLPLLLVSATANKAVPVQYDG